MEERRLRRRDTCPTPWAVAVLLAAPTGVAAQVELCRDAEHFVREVVGMAAITEPDTIDDWRTRAMVPGCRVTAAGVRDGSAADVARRFFEGLPEAGWIRTPDPRDAPNEASLRFRQGSADCLFNYYDGAMSLGTEAELTVLDAVVRGPGQAVFNFLVLCTPIAPAAPRGGSG